MGARALHATALCLPGELVRVEGRHTFKAVVEVVETLGAEVQLDVVSGEHNLVARVDPRTKAERNQEMTLAVNMEKIHIFDTEPPNVRIKTEEYSPI